MQITEQRLQTISLLILTVVVCGAVLHLLQNVFMPFVLAVFFALGLSPIVNIQVRIGRFPVVLAILTTLALTFILFWLAGLLVTESVEQLTASAATYELQIEHLVQVTVQSLPLQRFGVGAEQLLKPLQDISIESLILKTAHSILDGLSLFLLVFVFMTYLLFVLAEQKKHGAVWQEIESRIKHYLLAKTVVSVMIGWVVGAVLYLFDVELALVFGLFACVLNFIPAAGPVIASLLPWPVIFMSPDLSTAAKLFSLFFPGTLFFFTGNFLEPRVLGDSTQLHPLTVLLVLVFWGVLWGPIGMLLAIPITSVLAMLSSRMEITRPVANLLSGNIGATRSKTD